MTASDAAQGVLYSERRAAKLLVDGYGDRLPCFYCLGAAMGIGVVVVPNFEDHLLEGEERPLCEKHYEVTGGRITISWRAMRALDEFGTLRPGARHARDASMRNRS